MFEFLIILISVKDMANFYGFVLFVHRIYNAIFTLIHAVSFKACIIEILQFFTVLRLWISPE